MDVPYPRGFCGILEESPLLAWLKLLKLACPLYGDLFMSQDGEAI